MTDFNQITKDAYPFEISYFQRWTHGPMEGRTMPGKLRFVSIHAAHAWIAVALTQNIGVFGIQFTEPMLAVGGVIRISALPEGEFRQRMAEQKSTPEKTTEPFSQSPDHSIRTGRTKDYRG